MTRAKSKGAKRGGDKSPAVQQRRATRGRAMVLQTASSKAKARNSAVTSGKKIQTPRKNRPLAESSTTGTTERSKRLKAKQTKIAVKKKTVAKTEKKQATKRVVLRGIDRLRELEKSKGKKTASSPDTSSMVTRQVRKRLAEAAGLPSKKARGDVDHHSTRPVQLESSDPETTVTSNQTAARETRQRGVRSQKGKAVSEGKQRTSRSRNSAAKTKRGKTAGSKTRTTRGSGDEIESETESGVDSKAGALRKLVARLDTRSKQKQLDAARNLRIRYCHEITSTYHITGFYNKITEQLIKLGVVPKLVEIFRKEDMTSQLRYEACWILNNIAGSISSHTREIFQANIMPDLVAMASIEEDDPAREIALATLGNLSGDCATYRDAVLDSGIVPPLINILRTSVRNGTLNDATDLVGNLARDHGSTVDIQKVTPLLEPLKRHLNKDGWMSHANYSACWAVQRIAKQTCSSHVEDFSERGENSICQLLVKLCREGSNNVIAAAVAALGSIVSGNSDRTQAVIDAGALEKFGHILDNNVNELILEKTLFALSNITAGTKDQLQATIKSEIIPKVLGVLHGLGSKSKREAVLVLQNFLWNGDASHVRYLIDIGAIAAIGNLLSPGDTSVLTDALQCIRAIINHHPSFRKDVLDAGVVLNLTALLESNAVDFLRPEITNLISDCERGENDS
ncbi:uncharacterized protein [Diadema antillarum]|uniref:uncharacterized protein isoform X2 n=1 Tax=Diadema antillarum TaxID=105358 RepID=UPI003A8898E0